MTDDLVDFIRARLDDDEQAACAAALQVTERAVAPAYAAEHVGSGGKWSVHPWLFSGRVEASVGPHAERVEIATLANEHIARHDPAQVLADIDAKRRIIDYNAHAAKYHEPPGAALAMLTLRALAVPYRSHPDYQPKWAPTA